MTGFTVTEQTTLDGVLASAVGCAVLTDGTLLVVAGHQDSSGVRTITHYAPDLAVIDSAPWPPNEEVAAVWATPTGAVVLGTAPYTVTTGGGLAVSAGADWSTPVTPYTFADYAIAPVVGPDGNVHIFREGMHYTATLAGAYVSAQATPWDYGVSAHPSGLLVADDGTVWNYTTHTQISGATASGTYPLAATDPASQWVVAAQDDSGIGQGIYDGATGALTATYAAAEYRYTPGASASVPGGVIAVSLSSPNGTAPTGDDNAVALDHFTAAGPLTHTTHHIPTEIGLTSVGGTEQIAVTGGRWVAVTVHRRRRFTTEPDAFQLNVWTGTIGDARLKVGVIQGGAMIWRKVGDESWADGPGRMKLGVPRSLSPSGWMMEVKPGDDTTGARTMHLDINGGDEVAAVRFIPAE